MKHCLKNIMIIDRERFGDEFAAGARWVSVSSSTLCLMDIALIEEPDGNYWVMRNRFGLDRYILPKERLPLFLQNPMMDYR